MITLQYKLTLEDRINAYRFTLGLENWLACLSLIIFNIVYLVSSYIFGGLADFYDAIKITLLMTFMFFFMFFFFTPFRFLAFSQQKKFQTEYKAVISPEMIEIISEYRSMRMHLTAFQKYRVSKDLIVLYDSWGLFHIFPRRSFPSQADYLTFLSYLEANLGKPQP